MYGFLTFAALVALVFLTVFGLGFATERWGKGGRKRKKVRGRETRAQRR